MLPVLFLCLFSIYSCALQPSIVTPIGYNWLRRSNQSTLYTINLPNATGPVNYAIAPYLLVLRGSRYQIGYDYAALLNQESLATLDNFVSSLFSPPEQLLFFMFVDYLWDTILVRYTPPEFLEELRGMQDGYQPQGPGVTIDRVATRFYTFANLPADPQNIIAMLEQELEGNWPFWLKTAVNDIIALLEKLYHGCDAYGVWGSRTKGGLLYSSRNLDFNSNTGIDNYKLVTYYHINDPKFGTAYTYNSIGFAFGLGALAGMSAQGVTVSEMNLDNSDVTFSGLAFPLRLRYILERSTNLQEAMTTWNATNNTNSFNFLIGSANDAKKNQGPGAFALETMMGFTAVYGDNNPIEASSKYYCGPNDCKRWTNQTGWIHIGKPIKEAVFRSNHGFSPVIMASQEPLFNNTVFRYNLMHDLFVGYQKKSKLITDFEAVYVAASAATKGDNYFSCDPRNFQNGDNVMSIIYAPGSRSSNAGDLGHFYIAWEQNGLQHGTYWRPAACNSYVLLPMNIDPHLELAETMRLTKLVKQKHQQQGQVLM